MPPTTGNNCGFGLITVGGIMLSLIMLSIAVDGRLGRTTFGIAATNHHKQTMS